MSATSGGRGAAPVGDEPAPASEPGVTPASGPQAPWWSRTVRLFGEANPLVLTVLAMLSAVVLGGVLIDATSTTVLHAWSRIGSHPGRALSLTVTTVADAYGAIFTGSIISPSAVSHAVSTGKGWTGVFTPLSETATYATPLIFAGLGVALGFSTGVFNIGAQGQLIGGALAALYAGFELHLPIGIHLPLVVLAGAAGGAAVGFVPGILKARTGAHEVIVTIMLNYVMIYLLDYLLTVQPFQQPGQTNAVSRVLSGTARQPHLFGSGLSVNLSFILALAMGAAMSWFMRSSTLGFSFRVIGSNPDAGRTAGMSVAKVTTLVMTFSGLLAGMAGMATLTGTDFYLSSPYGGNIGFDAITVALLGRNKPVGVLLGSLLWASLEYGAKNMQLNTGIPVDLASVVQALIVFFIATPLLVRDIYHLRQTGARGVQLFTKGWSG